MTSIRSQAYRTQFTRQRQPKNGDTYNEQRFIRGGKPQSVGNYSSGRRVGGGMKLRARAIGTAVENTRHANNTFA